MSKTSVSILLVGDTQVGKTSLFNAYRQQIITTNRQAPPSFESEINTPTDAFHFLAYDGETVNNVIINLYDTITQDTEVIDAKICRSDIVILLYDRSNMINLENTLTNWINRIRIILTRYPTLHTKVLLCGNKSDLFRSTTMSDIQQRETLEIEENRILINIIRNNTFTLKEINLKISCNSNINDVNAVIHCAITSSLYPIYTLFESYGYDTYDKLTHEGRARLLRVFCMLDSDYDGLVGLDRLSAVIDTCVNDTSRLPYIHRLADEDMVRTVFDVYRDELHLGDDLNSGDKSKGGDIEGFLLTQPTNTDGSNSSNDDTRGKGGVERMVTFNGFLAIILYHVSNYNFSVPYELLARYDDVDVQVIYLPCMCVCIYLCVCNSHELRFAYVYNAFMSVYSWSVYVYYCYNILINMPYLYIGGSP